MSKVVVTGGAGFIGSHLTEEMLKGRAFNVNAIILAVAHAAFLQPGLKDLRDMRNDNPILPDVPGIFDTKQSHKMGSHYVTL